MWQGELVANLTGGPLSTSTIVRTNRAW
jgi:hypothetical protein